MLILHLDTGERIVQAEDSAQEKTRNNKRQERAYFGPSVQVISLV